MVILAGFLILAVIAGPLSLIPGTRKGMKIVDLFLEKSNKLIEWAQ